MILKLNSSSFIYILIVLLIILYESNGSKSRSVFDYDDDKGDYDDFSNTATTTTTTTTTKTETTTIKFHRKKSNHMHHHNKNSKNSSNVKLKNSIKRQEKSTLSSTIQQQDSLFSSKSIQNNYAENEPDFDYSLGKYQKEQLNYDMTPFRQQNYDPFSSSNVASSSAERPQNAILTNLTVILGQNALFTCSVKNIGQYKILWLRIRDGDVLAFEDQLITQDKRFKLLQKTNKNESSLFLQGVKLSDAGEYACQLNTNTLKSKLINLIVLTPPVFTDTDLNSSSNDFYSHLALASSLPNSKKMNSQQYYNQLKAQQQDVDASTRSIQVIEGKSINLECNAFGNPKPTINWYVKRYKSVNLTVYSLNSNKITVNNVMRRQYEYFECEATNKLPPSVSKKFKINVSYRPEIIVTPSKVQITKLPFQVRFNCSVSAYPLTNVYWTHSFTNPKSKRNNYNNNNNNNHSKKSRETANKKNNIRTTSNLATKNRKLGNRNLLESDNSIPLEHIKILNTITRYTVSEQIVNETLKHSTILINVESEDDLGVYECYSNNTAGYRAVKFHIYGEQFKSSTTINSLAGDNKNKQINQKSTKSPSNDKYYNNENDDTLLIDEKLLNNDKDENINREIKFDLTTISNLQTSSSSTFKIKTRDLSITTSFILIKILFCYYNL